MSWDNPTTDEVRTQYVSEPEDVAAFDRWQTRIKAEAWDAAALYLGINEQEHLGEWLWERNQFDEERSKP